MSRPRQNQRGRAMPPPMTAAQKREMIRKQRLARRKTIRTLREKDNKTAQEKQFLNAVKKMRQQKRTQRMINKQRQNEQNRLTKPKVSQQVRPTKATQKPLSPYKRKVVKPQRVTQPPPPRRVVRSQVRRRAPVVRARGRG